MAKVSIIVPAYNCEAYVEESIRSVMNQTERDIQILAVNDGSNDRTLRILERLACEDRRIELQSFSPNSGYPGFARNRALEHATGEYIAFLDADDLYEHDKIGRTVSVLERFRDADVVFHDVMRFDGELVPGAGVSFLRMHRFTELASKYLQEQLNDLYVCHKDLYRFASLNVFPCHTSAIVIRREALLTEDTWFPEGRHGEDGDLWLRLLMRRRVLFLDEVLSYYRQRAGSVTSSSISYLGGAVRVHRDNLERGKLIFSRDEQKLYRAKIAQLLSDLGYAYHCRYHRKEARNAYLQSMAAEFRLGRLMSYLKTFAPQSIINYRQLRQNPQH